MTDRVADAETTGSDYRGLYKLGGVAAWIAADLTLSEVIVLALYPQPGTVSDWFTLFQNRPIIGLLDFWGLERPMYVMLALVFLALYVALRRAGESRMAVALTFALLGIGIFFATNNPLSMLSLSNQYAAATTEAQRSTLLAAGEALVANTGQRAVGGFNTGLFMVSIAGLIASSVMLRAGPFTKLTAYVGILAHTLSLADYVRQAVTQSAMIALVVILPNALLLMVWFILAGGRLYRLGRVEGKAPAKGS